jgi:hypothetical protein
MAAPILKFGGATAFKILRSLYKGGGYVKKYGKKGMEKVGMSTNSAFAQKTKKVGSHLRKHHKVYSAGATGYGISDLFDND